MTTYEKVLNDFLKLYEVNSFRAVCDLHPDYLSSKFTKKNYADVITIQHHEAHLAACRAENPVVGEAIGVSWDGVDYLNGLWVAYGEDSSYMIVSVSSDGINWSSAKKSSYKVTDTNGAITGMASTASLPYDGRGKRCKHKRRRR